MGTDQRSLLVSADGDLGDLYERLLFDAVLEWLNILQCLVYVFSGQVAGLLKAIALRVKRVMKNFY